MLFERVNELVDVLFALTGRPKVIRRGIRKRLANLKGHSRKPASIETVFLQQM